MMVEDVASGLDEDHLAERQRPHPSFAEFWRRNRELHEGRNIRNVESHSTGIVSDAQTKAEIRRDQVRKAQRQHRERKANYTKELEMDIARLRGMIYQVEEETRALKSENDAIRQRLSMEAIAIGDVNLSLPKPMITNHNSDLPPATRTMEYNAVPEPVCTVRMDMSDLMQTPTFRVTRALSEQNGRQSMDAVTGCHNSGVGTVIPQSARAQETLVGGLTQKQTDLAINFILALEHICWSHFDHSCFAPNPDGAGAAEHGHSLMASTIALQHAPAAVFERIDAAKASLRSPTLDIAWRSTDLTLESLYHLANTLNPPDRELAPVQAWFEISREYGPEVALDAEVLEALEREFCGVVKCLHFGAVIERDAFDSILRRVLGTHWETKSERGLT